MLPCIFCKKKIETKQGRAILIPETKAFRFPRFHSAHQVRHPPRLSPVVDLHGHGSPQRSRPKARVPQGAASLAAWTTTAPCFHHHAPCEPLHFFRSQDTCHTLALAAGESPSVDVSTNTRIGYEVAGKVNPSALANCITQCLVVGQDTGLGALIRPYSHWPLGSISQYM